MFLLLPGKVVRRPEIPLQRGVFCRNFQNIGSPQVTLVHVVSFAMELWSQEVIEEALGDNLATVIPELVRLARLEVQMPRFEIVALERVAEREGKSVDAVLARELLDFVSVHSPWIGAEMAGFAEALVAGMSNPRSADAPSARS